MSGVLGKEEALARLEQCWIINEEIDEKFRRQSLTARERKEEDQKKAKMHKPRATTKKKQMKISAFIKKVPKPTVYNFQGFSMNRCEYNAELKQYLMVPRGYGDGCYGFTCEHCYLRPCIRRVYHQQFISPGIMVQDSGGSNEEAMSASLKAMEDVMNDIFGKRYTKRVGTPTCVLEIMDLYFPSSDYSSSSDEEETEFQE